MEQLNQILQANQQTMMAQFHALLQNQQGGRQYASQTEDGEEQRPHRIRGHDAIEEKWFRKLEIFKGTGWRDWSFKFKNAVAASSLVGRQLLDWAEKEDSTITNFKGFLEATDETADKLDAQLFHQLSSVLGDDPLQILRTSDGSGSEAWRRLCARFSPTTPMRGMNLMMAVVSPPKAKSAREIARAIDVWEAKVLMLQRDFKETLSSKMKAALLVSMLPDDIQQSVIQNAEKYELYEQARDKVISIADSKMAISNPDQMDVDYMDDHDHEWDEQEDPETCTVGKGPFCYRCGGQGHIARNCATPEPTSDKSKGDGKGGGKGKGKGKGKGGKADGKAAASTWRGYCSYCGKPGHAPKECRKRLRDEEGKSAEMAMGSMEHEGHEQDCGYLDHDIPGFEIGSIDSETMDVSDAERKRIETSEWKTVETRRRKKLNKSKDTKMEATKDAGETMEGHPDSAFPEIFAVNKSLGKGRITIDSGAAESVMPKDFPTEFPLRESAGSKTGVCYITANGSKMPNLGERRVHFRTANGSDSSVLFQVTHARKPLASVAKIVQKGNRVVFSPEASYIEHIRSGKRVPIVEANGTYHLDVEYALPPAEVFSGQA